MKNRYMIVTYYRQPDGQYDEITEFKNSVKGKHLQESKVILDLEKKQVVKNGLNFEATFEDLFDLYKKLLGKRLDPYLDQQSP
jgi:RNA recognition motif-containing protein